MKTAYICSPYSGDYTIIHNDNEAMFGLQEERLLLCIGRRK